MAISWSMSVSRARRTANFGGGACGVMLMLWAVVQRRVGVAERAAGSKTGLLKTEVLFKVSRLVSLS